MVVGYPRKLVLLVLGNCMRINPGDHKLGQSGVEVVSDL